MKTYNDSNQADKAHSEPHRDAQGYLPEQQPASSKKRHLITAILWACVTFVVGYMALLVCLSYDNAAKADGSAVKASAVKTTIVNMAHGGYDKDLSKTISGQANRHTMAFFVSEVLPVSQTGRADHTAHLTPSQGKTIYSKANACNGYDGVTSQNTIAIWRICGAVTNSTESEPHHLMLTSTHDVLSVVSTQKLLGGHTHA